MQLLVVFGLILFILVVVVVLYNALVRLRVLTENSWADVGVQLKRRYDLVPNLVKTVQGYAAHEKTTLEEVVAARNRALQGSGPAEQSFLEGEFSGALKSLLALAESYPQLRASENFRELQTQLAGIEEAIQSARRYYNATVRDLNTRIEQFPWNLIARLFGFQSREFFEVEAAANSVPEVDFQL